MIDRVIELLCWLGLVLLALLSVFVFLPLYLVFLVLCLIVCLFVLVSCVIV